MTEKIRGILEELFFGKMSLDEAEGRIDFLLMSKDVPSKEEVDDDTNEATTPKI